MQQRITPNGFPFAPSTAAKVLRKVVKDISIDSRDYVARGKCNGVETDGEYWVHLPNTYKSVYSAQLLNIALPYTFDEITSTDTLDVVIGGGDVSFTGSVSIPAGTYTLTTLLAAVATALGKATTPNRTYTITQTNGIVTIDAQAADTIQITGGTLAGYLGFTTLPTAAGQNVITGNCPANPRPVPYLLMEVEFLNQVDETQLAVTPGNPTRKSGSTDSIFTKIDLVGDKNDYIYLSEKAYNFNVTTCNPPLGRLQTLHVKFRTHDGRTINFCNIPHSYILRLELLDNNFDEFSSSEFTPMR